MKKRIAIILVLVIALVGIVYNLIRVKEGASAEIENPIEIVEPVTIKISAVGDIMLGRYVATLIGDSFDKPFEEVADILNDSDIRFGNLECVLSDNELKNIKGKDKNFCLKGPAKMVEVLKCAGFNVLSLANNHIYDYDGQGLADTMYTLESNDITHIGAGENLADARRLKVVEINGTKITTMDELNAEKNKKAIGDTITLKVYRNGIYKDISLTLQEQP